MAKTKRKKRRSSDRITLEDVAVRCNVSKATVCRVLNDKLNDFPVSQEMIDRVKQTAAELGYRPNRLAQAIRTSRTYLIGLSYYHIDWQNLSPNQTMMGSQELGKFASLIQSHPGFRNYDLVMHARRELDDRPLYPSDFKTELLDGMIYITPSENHTEFLSVASPDFPVVVMGYMPEAAERVPCVDMNNVAAAEKVVGHLVETGRKNILAIIPHEIRHLQCIKDRIQGYRQALLRHGLASPDEYIRVVEDSPNAYVSLIQSMPFVSQIDAVFCPTDIAATLLLQACEQKGIRVPQDLAITGFDNTFMAKQSNPPLTTISRSVEEMVFKTTDLMLKILNKEAPYEPGLIEIESTLEIRESTATC